ncbi:MAG: outer membrane beta-barrel protein [Kordiimonas sp.]
MKKTTRGLIAGLAIIMAGATARAADGTFSGAYVGLEFGYGSVEFNGAKDNDKKSFGGIAGYRHQFENDFVLGGEFALANVSYDSWGGYDHSTVDFKHSWAGSALIGYAFGAEYENLLYGKIGYNRIRFDVTSDGNDGAPANVTTRESDGGMRYGVGYERKFSDMFSIRVGADYSKHKGYYKQFEGKAAFILTF